MRSQVKSFSYFGHFWLSKKCQEICWWWFLVESQQQLPKKFYKFIKVVCDEREEKWLFIVIHDLPSTYVLLFSSLCPAIYGHEVSNLKTLLAIPVWNICATFNSWRTQKACLGQGEGAGTVFTGGCGSQSLSVSGKWRPNTLKFSDAEGKVTAASSGELSVMVTTTKYSPVLACITTDCEGRSGPGPVWRMPEVCGWQEQDPSARRSTCSGCWRSRIRKKPDVASMVSLITVFCFSLFPCYLDLEVW